MFTTATVVLSLATLILAVICVLLGRKLRRLGRENADQRILAAQTNQKLSQAHRMEAVGQLAGGIVNNLNNLLAVIMGRSRLALQSVAPESTAEGEIKRIVKAGGMAVDLVQEISDYYTEADRANKPTDLAQVVTDTLELLRDILPANVCISQDIDRQSGPVMASSTGVQQILLNLFSHAARSYGSRDGDINVSLQRQEISGWHKAVPQDLGPGQYLKLAVLDNGPGMDPRDLERIFDAYESYAGAGSGDDPGLSTLYRTLEEFDGVTIAKGQPGKGSRFEVFFPCIAWSLPEDQASDRPEPHLRVINGQSDPTDIAGDVPERIATVSSEVIFPEDLTVATKPDKQHGTVLLVDDEEMVAKVVATGLRRKGFRVIFHTDSRKALADFVQTPDLFDALVTDQIMPHMSGVRLTRQIHEIRPDLPVILVTGFRDSFNDQQAREAGVTDFLLKPTSYRDLADLLNRTMLRSRAGRG